MNYHLANLRKGSDWRSEAWLECTPAELNIIQELHWEIDIIAELRAPRPWLLETLNPHVSFGGDGLYDHQRQSRTTEYSFAGELQKRIFDGMFNWASRQKVRLKDVLEPMFVQGSQMEIEQFNSQSSRYVDGLNARFAMATRS